MSNPSITFQVLFFLVKGSRTPDNTCLNVFKYFFFFFFKSLQQLYQEDIWDCSEQGSDGACPVLQVRTCRLSREQGHAAVAALAPGFSPGLSPTLSPARPCGTEMTHSLVCSGTVSR